MNTMFQPPWCNPLTLNRWREAPLGEGLYIIGCAQDERLPMGPCTPNDGKLGGFPVNFVPLYIGHSLSSGRGVRARLSSHYRRRGNPYVSMAVRSNVPLWFLALTGRAMAEYESTYLDLPNGIYFPFNSRSEVTRALKRMYAALQASGFVAQQAAQLSPLPDGIGSDWSHVLVE